MKKGLQLTALFLLLFMGAFSQNVPQGMKYQAVARDLSGNIMADQQISLKISLVSTGKSSSEHYTEIHNVTTNGLGLFSLVIGEGKIDKGNFENVPWSTDDIWMQVSIKEKTSPLYTIISNSKLLAVPYAFHSGTASKLVNQTGLNIPIATVGAPSIISSGTGITMSAVTSTTGTSSAGGAWLLAGNRRSNPVSDYLGTADAVDLVLRTSDIERLRILANGNVSIHKDLTVTGATALNNKVDITGITAIKNNTQSTDPITGALVVTGGVGIGGNLNVGGETNFKGGVTTKGISITDDNADFVATITNTNTGEGDGLKIKLGRVHPLWNGTAYEVVTPEDYKTVYGAFNDQINLVDGWITSGKVNITPGDLWSLVKNTGSFLGGALCQLTNAISPTLNEKIGLPFDLATPINSQLKLPFDLASPINTQLSLPLNITKPVNAGIGLPFDLTKPINTGLGLPVNFSILSVLNSAADLLVPDGSLPGPSLTLVPALPSLVIPAIPDLIIPAIPKEYLTIPAIPKEYLTIPAIPQIDCSNLFTISMPTIRRTNVTNSLTNKNEFVRFADKDERVVGMIRAQSIGDYSAYLSSKEYLFTLVAAAGGIDIARGLISLAKEFKKMNDNYNKLGVEYISGNGDYAEWMQRENLYEAISAGDIVAVKGGKITKDLRGAEQIMAVSTAPIVNANMPNENRVALGNSIAFMGQIPVKIMGSVATGDFIVAKGNIAGYGVAIKSSDMTTEDFRLVVGRAWETMEAEGPKMVNTLVGVQNNDFLKIIEKYQQKLATAEARVSSTEERLNAIEQKLNMPSATKKNNQRK